MTAASNVLVPPEPAIAWQTVAQMPWQRLLAPLLSVALLVALGVVLRGEGFARLRGALPASPIFWVAFAAYYLALPASEWLIYRRIWKLPPSAFWALLRKLVSNEMLLGYSGELSFYLYARRVAGLTTSPFQAIKDVSILSAAAGNIATIGMALLAYPVWHSWAPHLLPSGAPLSLALLFAVSGALVLLRRQLFSLPRDLLRFVGAAHCMRIVATTVLLGLMWASALPQVALATWIGLAALQLVVTRLPLVPNKDVVFAGAAMLVVGAHSDVAALMALVASLLIATHLVTGMVLLLRDITTSGEHA